MKNTNKQPSKTAIRQAMHHHFGYTYRLINSFFNVRLINIWYSINGYYTVKWHNRSKKEQELAIMAADALVRKKTIDAILAELG